MAQCAVQVHTVPALSSTRASKGELSSVTSQLIWSFPDGPKWWNTLKFMFFGLAKYVNKTKLLEISVQCLKHDFT